jgi:deoxyribodipyrimidine photolyase-related protein
MEPDGTPTGGRYSYDSENRKKLPRGTTPPEEPRIYEDDATKEALLWLKTVPGEHYGEATIWLPYTHAAAKAWLDEFLSQRLSDFGPYEDAISAAHTRLWHSALSPLMNIGLLTPQQVIAAAIEHTKTHDTPLPSLEGFLRQVIGWREFIRAAYEADGRTMRKGNFWQHTKRLPTNFWTGDSGVTPVDDSIKKALTFGYTHHIERLMVLGNFMVLSEIHPDEVYRWFMAMYVDAYDWVMVPNVYGMSQFADGGSFATKPYISGSNYIRKMSDYKAGDWSELWDSLYWHFIHTHQGFFSSNHRLSMMPKLLEKMEKTRRDRLLSQAKTYLKKLA